MGKNCFKSVGPGSEGPASLPWWQQLELVLNNIHELLQKRSVLGPV